MASTRTKEKVDEKKTEVKEGVQQEFDSKPLTDVTIQQFEVKIKEYYDQKSDYEQLKFQAEKSKEILDNMGEWLLAFMRENNKTSYNSSYGHLIRSERWSYKTPKTPEQKDAFYAYLKEKGLFDTMISVNSQTLNSFAKKEVEAAKEDGDIDFQIPGLEEPSVQEIIALRR